MADWAPPFQKELQVRAGLNSVFSPNEREKNHKTGMKEIIQMAKKSTRTPERGQRVGFEREGVEW